MLMVTPLPPLSMTGLIAHRLPTARNVRNALIVPTAQIVQTGQTVRIVRSAQIARTGLKHQAAGVNAQV